jgi:hypothetical protein
VISSWGGPRRQFFMLLKTYGPSSYAAKAKSRILKPIGKLKSEKIVILDRDEFGAPQEEKNSSAPENYDENSILSWSDQHLA